MYSMWFECSRAAPCVPVNSPLGFAPLMHTNVHMFINNAAESGVHLVNITGMCLLMRKLLPSVPSPYQWARTGLCVIKTDHSVYSQRPCLSVWNLHPDRRAERTERRLSTILHIILLLQQTVKSCCDNKVKTMSAIMMYICESIRKIMQESRK